MAIQFLSKSENFAGRLGSSEILGRRVHCFGVEAELGVGPSQVHSGVGSQGSCAHAARKGRVEPPASLDPAVEVRNAAELNALAWPLIDPMDSETSGRCGPGPTRTIRAWSWN